MTHTTQSTKFDDVMLKTLEEMASVTEQAKKDKEETDAKKGELLAEVFDKVNPKTAKQIRKKGLPVSVILGSKLHDIWATGLSYYCKVYSHNLIDEETYVFSWEDYNPYRPLGIPLLVTEGICKCYMTQPFNTSNPCIFCGKPKR